MYSLQVKARRSSSKSSDSGGSGQSIRVDGRSAQSPSSHIDEDMRLDEYHDDGRPLTPQSWVQKIGSAMFHKIKIAPSTETPVVIKDPSSSFTTTPATNSQRPAKFALNLEPEETRIAIAPADDREDPKPVLARTGSLSHQSLEFIKVYCSPKRPMPSPKIKPMREDTRRVPERDPEPENDDISPAKAAPVRHDVVPVLQSFFSRPKANPKAGKQGSGAASIDARIHRQEQYKRDLARQEQLRASGGHTFHPNEDLVGASKFEALRTHARSLKRQRIAQVKEAKHMLRERLEQDQQHILSLRREWESDFEDDIQALATAFAKCCPSDRPMTTAGLVVPEARTQVERDKVLHQLRAQTAPSQDPASGGRRTPPNRMPTPVIESRPTSSNESSTQEWLDQSQEVVVNDNHTDRDSSIEEDGIADRDNGDRAM
ncbi:hypothetical protein AeNC1_002823 [Aphanomyces euteiches]|nr:hypothetical protein AeNC1_002823 [Aphanomyces euteiches]